MGVTWSKINNSNGLFLYNYNLLNEPTILKPGKRAAGSAGVKYSKRDGSKYFETCLLILKRRALALFSLMESSLKL